MSSHQVCSGLCVLDDRKSYRIGDTLHLEARQWKKLSGQSVFKHQTDAHVDTN